MTYPLITILSNQHPVRELCEALGASCSGDIYNFTHRREIFEYIEIYYNRKRRHSGINYQIPDQYELLGA